MIQKTDSIYAVCIEFVDDLHSDFYDKGLMHLSNESSVDRYEHKAYMYYHDDHVQKHIITNIHEFLKLQKLNQSNRNIAFVVTSSIVDSIDTPQAKCNILRYTLSENTFDPFYPSWKPNKPNIDNKNGVGLECVLQWDFPEGASAKDLNLIEGYNIVCCAVTDTMNPWMLKFTPPTPNSLVTNIGYLQPSTSYVFKIAARYEYHMSEYTYSDESVPITTPDYVCHIARPGKPQVCRIEPNGITLRWEESRASSDDTVQHYVMYYRSKDGDGESYWNIVETTDTTAMITVENLFDSLPYLFKVVAVGKCGISEESEESDVITIKDHIPSKPGKPTVLASSRDSITITWDVPEHNALLVTMYVVKCSLTDTVTSSVFTELVPISHIKYLNHNTVSATISKLHPENFYFFQVYARTNYGISISSESSDAIKTVDQCGSPVGESAAVPVALPMKNLHSNSTISIDPACTNPVGAECSSQKFAPGKPIVSAIYADDDESDPDIALLWNTPIVENFPVKEYHILQCCLEESREYTFIKRITVKHSATSVAKSKSAKIQNLVRSNHYKYKVVAIYDHNTSVESKESSIIKASQEISSPGKPIATNVTENSVILNWTPPQVNSDFVNEYIIIDQNGQTWSKEADIDVTELKVELSPNVQYTFKVLAVGVEFSSEESEASDPIFTKPSAPSKPEQCAIFHNKVTLCWQPPASAGNITQYCVYYASVSDFGKVCTSNNEQLQMSITYLKPNTKYTFRVASMYGDVCSAISEESEPIKTEPYKCSEPGIPSINDSNFDEIVLSWTKPTKDSEIVISYTINCILKESGQEVDAKKVGFETNAKFINLQPNTDYTFRVIAHCKSGASATGPCKTIRTMKKVCSPPGVPTMTKSTHNSLSLTWQEPAKNSKLVNKYIIYKSSDVYSRAQLYCVTNDSKPEATVHDLTQNTGYSFKVVADCNGNVSEPSPTSEIMQTKKACSKPGKPVMTEYTYNSISLKWDKPTVQSDTVKYYFIKSSTDSNINNITEANQSKIENLSPNTTYIFQVIAHCDEDVDIGSEISDPITTDQAICSHPHDLTVSNETEYSAVVQWSAPVKYPELVKTYKVKYHLESDSNDDWISLEDTTKMKIIEKLKPDSTYKIKICVPLHNDVTCESEEVLFKTLPDVCSAPGTPTSADVTYNRIMLTWDEPEYHKHLLQHYSIMIYQDNVHEPIENQTKKQQIVLDSLEPDTVYMFKVIAVCKREKSESALSDPIRTKRELCSPPGVPMASSTTHNSITIHWNRPTECAHLIHHYDVYYKYSAAGEGEWEKRSTSEVQENKEINQLLPDRKYVFKVKAVCTNDTESEFSPCSKDIATRKRKIVEDLIPKAIAIPPTPEELLCYQLKPLMHKEIESPELEIAKYTFGKPPPKNIPEKILLLVGATGAGKSTMINGIVNYIFGVVSRDNYRLKLIHQESKRSESHSQTRWITSYTFYWQEGFPFPYTLTVIDTPGFGDTDGIERDKKLRQQIKQFFGLKAEDGGMEVVHGIGFLTQASLIRLTQTQRYIFDSMLAIFGNDVKKNIFILATFDDGGKSQIKQSISDAGIPTDKFYTFNNGTLFQQRKSDDAVWLKNYADFFQKLPEVAATSIQLSKEVLQEREHLQTVIEGLSQQVKIGLGKIDELAQMRDELEKIKLKVTQSKNFKVKTRVQDFRHHYLQENEYVTNCTQCTYTCHYPCAIPNDGAKYYCAAMDRTKSPRTDTNCTVCPKKCSWTIHKNNGFRIEPYMRDEIQTNTQLEAKYHQAIKDEKDVKNVIDKMEKEMKEVYLKVGKNIREMNKHLTKLKEIALKPDYITDEGYIDLLIQSEEEEAKQGYQKRIKYLQLIRRDIKIIAAAKNVDPDSFDHTKFFDDLKDT